MSALGSPSSVPQVSFGEAFRFWLKLGFISFGGPAGQIAIMHRELVERRRWISEERFLHALNYCMLLPGPEAQQLATYVGWLLHRIPGGLVAGGLFVLPSVFILLGLSYLYAAYGATAAVEGVLSGLRPVVVAIVCEAVLRIGRRAIRGRAHLLLAVAAFAAIYWGGVPFPIVVAGAALAGWLLSKLPDQRPESSSGIEDDGGRPPEAPPPHTLPSRRRSLAILAVGGALWLGGLAAVARLLGPPNLHLGEYLFFTKAALVTFGGAYAVLAYVGQAAVEQYGWLTHAQVVDGLALAETTPGPLIMVVQFVGFMAGWNHPPPGWTPAASALLGALLTTAVTFLPCFLFIFLGAPHIERLRGRRSLSAALAGVTAAVVGVILNLALVFGAAVMAPGGLGGPIDAVAVALAAAAFVALRWGKVDLLWIILAGALAGILKGALA
jgi:chromate transporter